MRRNEGHVVSGLRCATDAFDDHALGPVGTDLYDCHPLAREMDIRLGVEITTSTTIMRDAVALVRLTSESTLPRARCGRGNPR